MGTKCKLPLTIIVFLIASPVCGGIVTASNGCFKYPKQKHNMKNIIATVNMAQFFF